MRSHEAIIPHCRIGKIKPKNGSAEISVIHRPNDVNTELIEHLVKALAHARRGRCLGFALVSRVLLENEDVEVCMSYARDEQADDEKLIGSIDRLKQRALRGFFPDEF